AKRLVTATLEATGTVQTDGEVTARTQRIDVWYVPDATQAVVRAARGALGAMGATACGYEFFRRTPDGPEALECWRKQLGRYHTQVVRAAREQPAVPPPPLPPVFWVV